MKRFVFVWIMVFLFLATTSCTTSRNIYLSRDYTNETWQYRLASNPEAWKLSADRWFLAGNPISNETWCRTAAPSSAAISTMSVKVPPFHTIKVDGGFTTQIYGSARERVDLFGPNAGVASVSVEVLGDTLYIHRQPIAHPDITKVIVRIGVNQLTNLVQRGCGPVDVMRITSPNLYITATPSSTGDVYLSGHVRLTRVRQAGSGSIYVFGVDSRDVTVETTGRSGSVNLWGNVGVRSITHAGANDINIIGANSGNLCITACGIGKIGLKGFVRLRKVEAHDYVRVYVSQTASPTLYADAFDCAVIGLNGSAGTLYANAYKNSRIFAKTLCTQNVYATSRDAAHINVTASNKAYARACDHSSIYFYGPEYLLDRFEKGRGTVIAMGTRNWCNRFSEYRAYDYTDMHKQGCELRGAG